MDAAAPGWSRSSDAASRSRTRAARSAESRPHASRSALPTDACSRSGRWPSTFRRLCTWQRCTTPQEPKTSVMARRRPGAPSMTNSNVRSVGSPRVTRSLSRLPATAAVSVAPSRKPSTCFRPSASTPNAITMQWSRKTLRSASAGPSGVQRVPRSHGNRSSHPRPTSYTGTTSMLPTTSPARSPRARPLSGPGSAGPRLRLRGGSGTVSQQAILGLGGLRVTSSNILKQRSGLVLVQVRLCVRQSMVPAG